MISLSVLFYILIVLFALIGSMRGWAKEVLVTFSVVLGLFVIVVLERYLPVVREIAASGESTTLFWFRTAVIGGLTFAGYQTPKLPKLIETNRFVRDQFQDILLGFFLGGINAFLIFGSIWFYMHEMGYPFEAISAPVAGTTAGDAALRIIPWLAPNWLVTPFIYFAVVVAFIFLMVVFI